MKLKKWQRWLRDLLIFAVIMLGIQWWQARNLPQQVTAPELSGISLSGQPMALSDWHGQPVLVHFWATWCPICRMEEDSIDSIAEDYPVIAVATSSGTPTEIATYLLQQGVDFPVMLDRSGELAQRWNAHGVPASFVINSNGEISYATMGYSTQLRLRWHLYLAE
ncbi:MAG TPA: protein disulfide oxidoreductase [Oceanospirillaceae bacterium]|nr:protein disulfide oxidoreductase [Oceanospirillaceae bacterium]